MDNLNIDNYKNTSKKREKINYIDEQVASEKNKIKKINQLQDEIIVLNKHMNKCIDLLSLSLKRETNDNLFDDMYDENIMDLKKTMSILDEKINSYKRNIDNLYKERDKVKEEYSDKKE